MVRSKGEIAEWNGVTEEERLFWRRFRGGTLVGRRRENKWSDARCVFCRGENGGMKHVLFECEEREIKEAREAVLERIGREEGDEWERMNKGEKLWCTLGKEAEGFGGRWRCPGIWKEEWERARKAKEAQGATTSTRRAKTAGTTKKAKKTKTV